MRTKWISFLLVLVISGSLSPHASAQSPAARRSPSQRQAASLLPDSAQKFAPDRILVRFRAVASKAAIDGLHAREGVAEIRSFSSVRTLQLVRLPAGASLEKTLSQYRKDPNVLYAEPDYVVHIAQNPVVPNDPYFPQLWSLSNSGQTGGLSGADIHAPQAWGITTGSHQVVVGIIDTGVDYTHPDLAANIWNNPLDCNSNGVDDDANGYVDDCHGIDASHSDGDPADDNGHGTHVAGTIGAAGNNGVGVVGVNWQVSMVACKAINSEGYGFSSWAITCLEYFARMKDRGLNLVATNNSWGGHGYSQAMRDAIDSHRQRGILFVAAAGNESLSTDLLPFYPANYDLPNIVAVAATDSRDALAAFSNYGPYSVHLAAPGVGILSTFPPPIEGTSYRSASGTSMATPHVTGVAALLKAQDPARDWKAIKNLLLAGGDASHGAINTLSGRRLNAYRAMTCSNSTVEKRLLPRTNVEYNWAGEPFHLSAMHIKCASPGGPVLVLLDSGAATITLTDDGTAPDLDAGDGIYFGQITWSDADAGRHTLTFPGGDTITVTVIPHLAPYRSSSSTPAAYRTIQGTNLNLGDDDSAPITPPFPILFGGGSFANLFVNSNGTVSFGGPFPDSVNLELPVSGVPPFVAPFWDDLYPPDGGVFWEVLGSAPNRELVIEWRNVGHYDCIAGYTVSFQIVFSESSSDILFNYADTAFTGPNSGNLCGLDVDNGASATVGVQVQPWVATQFSFDSPSLADNTSILWQVGPLIPVISGFQPFTALAGDPGFTLRVLGGNFIPASVVRWNGADRPTTMIHSSELSATIPAGDLAAAGPASVTVFTPPPDGDGESLPATFQLYSSYPVPALTRIDPDLVLRSEYTGFFTVTGTDFVSGSVARWNGFDQTTNVESSTRLTFLLPYWGVPVGGTVDVTVFNPSPGGGISNVLRVTFESPVPEISLLSPRAVAPGGGAFALSVESGSGWPSFTPGTFASTSVVRWNGADRPTTYSSAYGLSAAISASDIATPGTAEITVFTPTPGGGTSNAATFRIVSPPPNDNLANAFNISVLPFSHTVDTSTATNEPADEPLRACTVTLPGWPEIALQTVWYKFTATSNGTLRPAAGGSFFPVMAVLDTSLSPLACLDLSSWIGPPPVYDFPVTAGTTYHFLIGHQTPWACPWCTASGDTLVFNLDVAPPPQTLTVTKSGSGAGTVTSSPAGIDCGSACAANFPGATQVRLLAQSQAGSTFAGWNGACTGNDGTGMCVVTMNAPLSVTAIFNLPPTFAFDVPPAKITVSAGLTAQFALRVNPQNGTFDSPVSFACSSGVPALSTCSFVPPTVTPGAAGASTTLSIATTGPGTASLFGSEGTSVAIWLLWPPLAIVGAGLAARGRRWRRMMGLIVLVLSLTIGLIGCAATTSAPPPPPPQPRTPAGTYTITVTATSGETSRTTSVTLEVR